MDGKIIKTEKERIRELEQENAALRAENDKQKSVLDYIAVCDYPEVFEDEEQEEMINE